MGVQLGERFEWWWGARGIVVIDAGFGAGCSLWWGSGWGARYTKSLLGGEECEA